MNQQNQQEKFAKEWNEICKEEGEISTKKRRMEEEKENMATKKQKIMDEILKGMSEKDEEIYKLKKEIRAMKMKMAKMETDLKAQNVSIFRKMPAELFNELFSSMPLENAFGLLAKMPNGILARNIQKMTNGIKMALKTNKWNEKDCGRKLKITEEEEGLKIIHSGPNEKVNCARTYFPIPSINLKAVNIPIIAFYFEMKILKKNERGEYFGIGFCTREFPLEGKYLGQSNSPHSIGIWRKEGICIDGTFIKLGNGYNSFAQGDVIGFGIIYSSEIMQCFATWNCELIGKAELPPNYAKLQLYPAIDMRIVGDLIGTNFGKEEWQFKQFNKLLQ